ncbi:phosphoenolpyruvate carboxykinase (ATP) [Erwinia sp. CGal63]
MTTHSRLSQQLAAYGITSSADIIYNPDYATLFTEETRADLTGWNGQGKRISIKDTRAIINAILRGEADSAVTFTLPVFNLAVPHGLNALSPEILDPRASWESEQHWRDKALFLANKFVTNFEKFTDTAEGQALSTVGPLNK